MNKIYQPLHHKYRPQCFDELVGQEAIASTLRQALLTNKIAPAYVFTGPRGTGKTSSARILAKSLNCEQNDVPTTKPCGKCELCSTITSGLALDVIEIDAASNTGVENIRELIERSRFAPVQARWKVYVIDECHMLSTAAFNALLKTLEEPPEKVVFILATTDPQRVLPTILSRCQRFDFRAIPLLSLEKHLEMISIKEEINIDSHAINLIAQHAEGGLRDAESMLDQLSLLPPPIKAEEVWEILGVVPEKEIINLASALAEKNPLTLIERCRELVDRGREPNAILQGIAAILRDLILTRVAPERPELSSISSQSHKELKDLSNKISIEKLLQFQEKLKDSEIHLRQSMQPRLWIEVLLLGLIAEPEIKSNLPTKKETLSNNSGDLSYATNNGLLEDSNIKTDAEITKDNIDSNDNASNLSELWQQILGSLSLPSTRMLLSQQAHLIKLTNDLAVIEVSKNWMGMVQGRVNLLEEAITKTLKSQRKVILENPRNNQQQYPKKADKKNQTKIISTTKPKTIELPAENDDLDKEISNNQSLNETKKPDSNEEVKNERPNSSNGNLDKNAKQLADFFNGKVIDQEI